MGAINYYTSKFVTVGYNLSNIDYENEYYNDDIQEQFDDINSLLQKEYFSIFSVKLLPGYYEGFTINIDFNYLYFDDYIEKQDALKELTKLKKFLIDSIKNYDCCVCSPGWCTAYKNYNDSIKAINEKIKGAKQYIKTIPTYKNFNFNQATL